MPKEKKVSTKVIHRSRETGRFVKASTWRKSKAQGGTRYVRQIVIVSKVLAKAEAFVPSLEIESVIPSRPPGIRRKGRAAAGEPIEFVPEDKMEEGEEFGEEEEY